MCACEKNNKKPPPKYPNMVYAHNVITSMPYVAVRTDTRARSKFILIYVTTHY